MSQEEVGELPLSFSFGERLVQKPGAFVRSGHPNPSLGFVVRWCLYNDLLSLKVIILLKYGNHIKSTIRFR